MSGEEEFPLAAVARVTLETLEDELYAAGLHGEYVYAEGTGVTFVVLNETTDN